MSTEIFRLEGEFWTVTFQGTTIRVRDGKGMRYLAQLLAHPDERFAVDALLRGGTQIDATEVAPQSGRPAITSGQERERMRSAVAKRIRAAIARLERHDTAIGHFLSATVRTGYTCVYQTDPGRPVCWSSQIHRVAPCDPGGTGWEPFQSTGTTTERSR